MSEQIELLLDVLLSQAELESGATPEMIAMSGRMVIPGMAVEIGPARNRGWTEEEDRFLEEHLGSWTEQEIGEMLGRTAAAVKIRWKRELRLPAPSKAPDILTARRVAELLGVDEHKPSYWVDAGMLPGTIMAGGRYIRLVRKVDLLRWALNPKNWIWFEREGVTDIHLRRLMEKRAARWGDEWWTTNQVAEYYGVINEDVKRQINLGKLKGVQAVGRSGRSEMPNWANWFILKSEATKIGFNIVKRGKGIGDAFDSEEGEAFMLLAYAVGSSMEAIARMQKVNSQTIKNRLERLKRRGQAELLSEKFGLGIQFRGDICWADWREHEGRFPKLAAAMRRFEAYLKGEYEYPRRRTHGGSVNDGMGEVMGVLAARLRYVAQSEEEKEAARKMKFGQTNAMPERAVKLMEKYEGLREVVG